MSARGDRQGGGKIGYHCGMNAKPLIFLLALTFLISGSTIVSAKQKFGDYEEAFDKLIYRGA